MEPAQWARSGPVGPILERVDVQLPLAWLHLRTAVRILDVSGKLSLGQTENNVWPTTILKLNDDDGMLPTNFERIPTCGHGDDHEHTDEASQEKYVND